MTTEPITVMQRYELKYVLNAKQTDFFCERLKGHMEPDVYGLTSIASLYYDTPDHRLIRASLEKPAYKEKIRLRSYGPATDRTPVFLELKRKADGIVYKRRIATTVPEAQRFLRGESELCAKGQINREITYFHDYYRSLLPACMIVYDRTAYFEPDGDLRLTIDRAPRFRFDDLGFRRLSEGSLLLNPGETILEIKVQEAIPLWLVRILADGGIQRGSISKYGEAYLRQIRSKAI